MTELLFLVLGAVLALSAVALVKRHLGFLAQTPSDYAGATPGFDIREQLQGDILCEGVIYGPTGRVTSRFVADFHATWDGDTGIMAEHFRYDSGATQDRAWQLTLSAGGQIRAEADDLVGPGTGQQSGAGVQLRYKIRLPEESGGHVLDVIDWMYLMENGTIINRSQFRKYGLTVAELVATMRRVEPAQTASTEADTATADARGDKQSEQAA